MKGLIPFVYVSLVFGCMSLLHIFSNVILSL